MSDYAESSTAAMYARSEDPMSRILRSDADVDMDKLIILNRQASPSPFDVSTVGTLTTAVFSTHKPSTVTKPTTDGTSYPLDDYKGKGKAIATYASSVSATHGSGSDNEIELLRDTALFGVGDWTEDGPGASRVLKGPARSRKRPRRPKHKKPVVIIQQERIDSASEEDNAPTTLQVSRHDNKGRPTLEYKNRGTNNGLDKKYLRQRRNKPQQDELLLAEEGRIDTETTMLPESKDAGISRSRFYLLIAITVAAILTLVVSGIATHYTGKRRMNCTKIIIFAATVLISCFIILAMIVARRALHEALLAGVLEFLVGFALVVEIHDFM